jgi:hypothetical protein
MIWQSKLIKQLIIGLTVFAASIVVSHLAKPHLYWDTRSFLLALIPVFPAIFVGFVAVRMLAWLDELQRKIQLNALTFSLVSTILVLFAAGLVGVPVSPAFILTVIVAFWAIGWATTQRRYS